MTPRLLVVENSADDPVGPLGDWLTTAGLTLQVVRPYAGDALPEVADGDGLLVLGGSMGALDDGPAPWLPGLRALMRAAVVNELPTLGVCLGGQLLAAANGGRVAVNPLGPEFGAQLVAKRASAATDPLFGELPITPDVLQWHFDAVVELPPGAVLLASSPGCAHQAFRLGRLAWGVQFHIETTPELIAEWAADDAAALVDYDVAELLRRVATTYDDLVEAWQPFAARFAAVLADPAQVRAPRGPIVSTAEPITDPAQIRAALAAERASAMLPMPTLDPGRA